MAALYGLSPVWRYKKTLGKFLLFAAEMFLFPNDIYRFKPLQL
jgi:hypothetical protein